MKTNAVNLVFPIPRRIRTQPGRVTMPRTFALRGERIPAWLRRRLALACGMAGAALAGEGSAAAEIRLVLDPAGFTARKDARIRTQAYTLVLTKAGDVTIAGPGPDGLRHGVVTLALMLEAAAGGASLAPCTISDRPVFAVRGFQIDMAREFFPPLAFLKRMVDRAVDLKFNTIWLYLENHFRASGLEDLSPKMGLTPVEARAISAYAAERGIDLVPGTNVLSHMEGWFRLERYSGFVDGAARSYPVLTRKEAWVLVRRYLDALARAFPSPNFHAGLDELLFTGTNPAAAEAIRKKGKPAYYADFACKVIRHLQRTHGKTVWIWDDMVLGKNIYRAEGFNDDYRKALDRIPRDVVMTHWYYYTNFDGKHAPIIDRVARTGRPFVVAPSAQTYTDDFGNLRNAIANQSYMAQCGRKHGAFGLINTHWESRYGCVYLAGWPLQALAAGFAWAGGQAPGPEFWKAMAFTLTGDTGTLVEYLKAMEEIQDILARHGIGRQMVRASLFLDGPHVLWRRHTGGLPPARRRAIRRLLERARRLHRTVGARDPQLKQAIGIGAVLFEEALNVMDAFDQAWGEYHRAAEIERQPEAKREFRRRIARTLQRLEEAAGAVERYRHAIFGLERETGHTPYDSHALGEWARAIRTVAPLVRAVVRDGNGLPYFEKLLRLPPCYYGSNLRQIQVQNTFHPWFGDGRKTTPPTRWVSAGRPRQGVR